MRIFVISLIRDAGRRAHATSQFDHAGLPFEFFDGITFEKAIKRQLFDDIDENEFLLNSGRTPTPGEVGCFAAHRELWALAARLGEPLMIMEDDFQLADNFAEAVAFADQVINRVGFLRLQRSSRAKRRRIVSNGTLTLSVYTKPPHCMMCYCISPTVARKFLQDTRVLDAPVDVYVKKYWEHGQPLYALTPYPVTQSPLIVETTIKGRTKQRKPWRVSAHRFLRKCRWQQQRLTFNFQTRLKPQFVVRAEGSTRS